MEYSKLGRSGLSVSQAALGTMNFGTGTKGSCDGQEATAIIGEFLDAGGNLIDTANIYNGGQSEEIVGRAIADRRDDVVLATKGGGPRGSGPNSTGLSRLQLTRALEGSLRRLDVDHIDLYQCHVWDPATPLEETMATLDGFVRSGNVRYLGCSNFTAAQIVDAQWTAQQLGATGFVSSQPHYSLLAREIEAEILPTCAQQGIGAITYGPRDPRRALPTRRHTGTRQPNGPVAQLRHACRRSMGILEKLVPVSLESSNRWPARTAAPACPVSCSRVVALSC